MYTKYEMTFVLYLFTQFLKNQIRNEDERTQERMDGTYFKRKRMMMKKKQLFIKYVYNNKIK